MGSLGDRQTENYFYLILSIEKDLAQKVSYEEAIKQFSELKARKVKF